MSEGPTISCRPDGPYLVKNLSRLDDAQGQALPCEAVLALCRCGGSANKPFCDGTHKKNGFSGARLSDATADRRQEYVAPRITIHDNRSICAHAGHCTAALAAVFKYGSEPWIDARGASAEAIVAAIEQCPSGALSYTLDGAAQAGEAQQPSITVTADGPYVIRGGLQLLGQDAAPGPARDHYTLCRCGGSSNKPFCDGTHWSIGFKDPAG